MGATKREKLVDPALAIREFFEFLYQANRTAVIGIDPGLSGAIVFIPVDGPRIRMPLVVDIPTITTRVKSSSRGKAKVVSRGFYDHAGILDLFAPVIDNPTPLRVIALEQQQPMNRPGRKDTPKTAFGIGMGFGMWHLFFMDHAMPLEEIKPPKWKKIIGLVGQDKDAARKKAAALFPMLSKFLAYVSDHNRAEALLIAEAVRREVN